MNEVRTVQGQYNELRYTVLEPSKRDDDNGYFIMNFNPEILSYRSKIRITSKNQIDLGEN